MRAVMAFLALGRLTKSSEARNRPENTFSQINAARKSAQSSRRRQINGNRNENGFGMDRDINGARGIFLRALGDSPFFAPSTPAVVLFRTSPPSPGPRAEAKARMSEPSSSGAQVGHDGGHLQNRLRPALACRAIFVSRSYGSLSKNTTRSKSSPRLTSTRAAAFVSCSCASWSWHQKTAIRSC